MQTQTIRKMIRKAVAHEFRTGNLEGLVRQYAQSQGHQPSREDIGGVVAFIQQYIEHTPALLDNMAAVAERNGTAGEMMPMLEAAEQYFLSPLDGIPDHLGLWGLTDDAYLAHSLIQALSVTYSQRTGNPLLPVDLAGPNQLIRLLIGEPLASTLDAAGAGVVSATAIQQSTDYICEFPHPVDLGPDPIWGYASVDEIVDTQLGAMGVV